ncbi:cyn-10 [Pristionchus pacificus]|nr:cyn-10 [Pristionchus pacificus]
MSVTLHTTVGDIKLELYCDQAPKACELNSQNFLALCASDYYKNCIFHRNIKDFMVQTGDPTGLGKGGQSIYGSPFEDEFSTEISHSKRGILSMANNGPNTNKSQFFITYAVAKHLDLKYTIFGHVIDGFDALEELESIKVDAKYRPVVEHRIKDSNSNFILIPSVYYCPLISLFIIRNFQTNESRNQHYNTIICSPSSTPSAVLDRVKQMNEYYEQYIEEYTEEVGFIIIDDGRVVEPERPREEKKV